MQKLVTTHALWLVAKGKMRARCFPGSLLFLQSWFHDIRCKIGLSTMIVWPETPVPDLDLSSGALKERLQNAKLKCPSWGISMLCQQRWKTCEVTEVCLLRKRWLASYWICSRFMRLSWFKAMKSLLDSVFMSDSSPNILRCWLRYVIYSYIYRSCFQFQTLEITKIRSMLNSWVNRARKEMQLDVGLTSTFKLEMPNILYDTTPGKNMW